jgi:Na+-translocating ferredoxin:NAD+ oxidoreductase RNF subunit RnfB
MIGVFLFTAITFVLAVILVSIHAILNRKELLIEKIEERLPGYNCGACGFGSCAGMAEQILKDKKNLKNCKPIKEEQYDKLMKYIDSRK